MSSLTQARLKELLDYNPDSWLFVWKVISGRRITIGDTAGGIHPQGYVRIRINGKAYAAHRLAVLYTTGHWPEDVVDHLNGKRADNRWQNLECVSTKVNIRRQQSCVKNTSGHINVRLCKVTNKWVVRVCGVYGGYHADFDLACQKAKQLKEELGRA